MRIYGIKAFWRSRKPTTPSQLALLLLVCVISFVACQYMSNISQAVVARGLYTSVHVATSATAMSSGSTTETQIVPQLSVAQAEHPSQGIKPSNTITPTRSLRHSMNTSESGTEASSSEQTLLSSSASSAAVLWYCTLRWHVLRDSSDFKIYWTT